MSLFIFSNNSSSTAASPVAPSDTTIVVQPGQGTLFAHPSAGQIIAVTLEDVSGNIEVTYCNGITGDTLTVIRAQEGTTALAFASGSRVEARVTEGMLAALLQKTGGDTLSGTTILNGVLDMQSGGSIRNGELSGVPVRGSPGETDNQFLVPAGGAAPTIGGSVVVTHANMVAQVPSGFALAQTNMVVMWAGSSGSVPAGWHLCDGTSGTPDLRDRFIVGAGVTYTLGQTGGSAATNTGSTDPSGSLAIGGHVLTLAEIPSHTHDFMVSDAVGYANSANPPFTIPMWSSSSAPSYHTNIPAGFSGGAGSQINKSAGGGASHTHSLSGTLAHVHTYTLPPYYALFYIMKL